VFFSDIAIKILGEVVHLAQFRQKITGFTMGTLDGTDSKLEFGLGMVGLVLLLVVSCFGNCRREVLPEETGENTPLSTEERKQLLNKFFDVGKRRKVSVLVKLEISKFAVMRSYY
jgi:hypothetical protein